MTLYCFNKMYLQGRGRLRVVLGVAALICCCTLNSWGNDADGDMLSRGASNTKECGRDCLYVMLRLHGINVTRKEVDRNVPVGELGSSMYELQKGLLHFGLKADVLKLTPDSLATISLPAVIHLGLTPQEGHYWVLLNLDEPKYPKCIDGSVGLFNCSKGELVRSWSGYALVVKRQPYSLWYYIVLTVDGLLGAILIWIGWLRYTSTHAEPTKN